MIAIRMLMEEIRKEGYSGPAVGARVFQGFVIDTILKGPYPKTLP